jgi:predicted ATPase
MKRIVLTGGPGAGKTTAAAALALAEPGRFAVVPEAATQVYQRLRTRWDRLDAPGRRDVQRRIYALQIEQEDRLALAHRGKVLLLDRGTLDGAAYWPDGADDYWRSVGTTPEAELARYDAVVWLQTCAAIGAYDGDSSNACRHEDRTLAVRRGDAVLKLWLNHPVLARVDAFPHFDDKLAAAADAVRGLITGRV